MARRAGGRKGVFGSLGRAGRWSAKAVALFVLVSILWVLLYRFVPPPVTFTQMGDFFGGHHIERDWMPIETIDRNMARAAIAAEDSKFCSHGGFDTDAIAAAMRRNAQGGGVIRGGSTISQQTAKNAFLWQGGGYVRKGIEAWFTFLIEHLWGKRRIMEVYLNVAETGIGTYGVNAGAQRYFGHDASRMTRNEAARIAAVLPLPKKRGVVAPRGFTRRYGNSIAARINIVARDGLDVCIYSNISQPPRDFDAPAGETRKQPETPAPPKPAPVAPAPNNVPGADYEAPATAAPEPGEEPTGPASGQGSGDISDI
jgi:monofunctional biosynthetic peptidoglycan transglycosylase